MTYDVAIIGAGVVGAFIARELSRYQLKVCIIERESDVGMGASKANTAIVHAGYDNSPGTLKASLNVRGNELMEKVSDELKIPFKRTGSMVLCLDEGEELNKLYTLYTYGIKNKVPGISIIDKNKVKELEPNVSDDVVCALYAPTAGIISSYEMTTSAIENSVDNGVHLFLDQEVLSICKDNDVFFVNTANNTYKSRFLVDAAGINSDKIAQKLEYINFKITPRKGEYLVLDKNLGNYVNSILFQVPSKLGKGILVTPTTAGNLMIGPNATDIDDKEDKATTKIGLDEIVTKAKRSLPNLQINDIVTSYAGLRAVPSTGDFIIKPSTNVKGFIYSAGIHSPGLTSAPAIGEYVTRLLEGEGLELIINPNFNPNRRKNITLKSSSKEEYNDKVKEDPSYGKIVCRCEYVSEGEIIDCIKRSAGARDLDGVKRRTRVGMGRCQGSFCSPYVIKLLSQELQIPLEEVTKSGKESYMVLKRDI